MKYSFYQNHYSKIMVLAAILGALTGYYSINPFLGFALFISKPFVNILELLSIPLIFLSIVSTISGMKSFGEMKQLGRKVLKYTLMTTIIAATVGLFLYILINPASAGSGIVSDVTDYAGASSKTYLTFISNLIPSNLVQLFGANGNVAAIVFFALLFSISILGLPKEQKNFLHTMFSSLFAAILQITQYVILFMPIGVFGFIAQLFHNMHTDSSNLSQLLWYAVCVLMSNVIQGLVVIPFFLWYKGISPVRYFKQVSQALAMAFFSKSSNVALPLTLSCAINRAGISKRVASFSLPLCSTINMNGCAAFILITVLFVSTVHGVHYSMLDMVLWIFIATSAAVGNAGIPMGCYFLASSFLAGMNIPPYLIGAILPFYTFFDMVETALNVWSDLSVTAVVDKELSEIKSE